MKIEGHQLRIYSLCFRRASFCFKLKNEMCAQGQLFAEAVKCLTKAKKKRKRINITYKENAET